jgi:hypothetical protein
MVAPAHPISAAIPPAPAPAVPGEVESLASRVGTAVLKFFTDTIVTLYEAAKWMCEKIEMSLYCICCDDEEELFSASPAPSVADFSSDAMIDDPILSNSRSHEADLKRASESVREYLELHQEYPKFLEGEKNVNPSKQVHIRWAATPLGKDIVKTSGIVLSESEAEDVETSMPRGPLLFALLMLRATVFQTKPLHFRAVLPNGDTSSEFPSGDVFEVPNFFTYKNFREQAANDVTVNQIIQVREDFWALTDKDKQAILEHIDSAIETFEEKGVKKFQLIPPTSTEESERREIKAQNVVISTTAEGVYRRLREYSSRVISNDLFKYTFNRSINP